jgi:hypothetical protein
VLSASDEFRKQAEDCREWARRALRPQDKVFWLKLAEDWQRMAEQADQSARPQDPV